MVELFGNQPVHRPSVLRVRNLMEAVSKFI